MALNPNITVVTPGELITAAHLNAIRSNLVWLTEDVPALNATQVRQPAPTTGAVGAGPSVLITVGNVAIPVGATQAVVHTNVSGLYQNATSGDTGWFLRTLLGAQIPLEGAWSSTMVFTATMAAIRYPRSWVSRHPVVAAGTTVPLVIQAERFLGTAGSINIDSQARITCSVSFQA